MKIGQKITQKLTTSLKNKYSSTSDNFWIRGIIQGIPAIGSTLDTWFFQFAEKEKQKRIEMSLEEYSRRLNELEGKIDLSYIEKNIEEYAFLFEKFLRYVSLEYRERMRKAFAILMANFSTVTYSKQQNKDVYLSKLSELSPDHLAMLKLAYEYTHIQTKPDFEKAKTVGEYIILEFKKKGLDEAIIRGLFTDLQSKGLINEVFHNTFGGGMYSYHVTALGETVLNLIKDDDSSK
jgi:hypothetical protein